MNFFYNVEKKYNCSLLELKASVGRLSLLLSGTYKKGCLSQAIG